MKLDAAAVRAIEEATERSEAILADLVNRIGREFTAGDLADAWGMCDSAGWFSRPTATRFCRVWLKKAEAAGEVTSELRRGEHIKGGVLRRWYRCEVTVPQHVALEVAFDALCEISATATSLGDAQRIAREVMDAIERTADARDASGKLAESIRNVGGEVDRGDADAGG